MPKRDTVTNNSAIVADWYAREREEKRISQAKGVLFPRLVITLSGPQYDTPEYRHTVACALSESCTAAELKALAAFVKLNQNSRSRIFPVLAMVHRSQTPDFRPLTRKDAQLLQDASKVIPSRKTGPYALAKLLQESNPRRYRRVPIDTLKKQLERAFIRLRKP